MDFPNKFHKKHNYFIGEHLKITKVKHIRAGLVLNVLIYLFLGRYIRKNSNILSHENIYLINFSLLLLITTFRNKCKFFTKK